MKKVHLLLVALVFATISIFSFCRSTNDSIPQEKEQKQEQTNTKTAKNKHVSKWDNGFSKKREGEDLGWFQTPEGKWIDTMREERHKYNAYPPHYNDKTYYPNFTIEFPDKNKRIINAPEYFNIQVKDFNQNFLAMVNPIKDSKNNRIKSLGKIELLENNNRFLSGYIIGNENVFIDQEVENDHNHEHDHAHPHSNNKGDEIMLDLKQFGDVFISQITIWKPKPKINEKEIETEIIVYDNQGKIIYQKNRIGSNSSLYVSKNKHYLIESGGGYINEDSKLPSFTFIYDLINQKVFWKKKSTLDCVASGIVKGSNFGMINIIKECDDKNPNNELFSINLENGKIYQYTSNTKIPVSKVRISEELELYYNTKSGKKSLSLEKDFTEVISLP